MDTKIEEVEQEIRKVEQQIGDVEGKLMQAATEADVAYLRKQEEQLRKKEEQLRKKEEQLRNEKEQLRKKELLLLEAGTSGNQEVDSSEEWIKQMLLPQDTLTRLPQHEHDLEKVLLPEQPGKLPVIPETFFRIRRKRPGVAEKYLISADGSELPVLLSELLNFEFGTMSSEMNVSVFLAFAFHRLFSNWRSYGSDTFSYRLLFNCNEFTDDSRSATTRRRCRPDTLLTASGCTFLVGEDNVCSLTAARSDLEAKMLPLSAMFYGDLQFILGYTAGGNEFQWVYIKKDGTVKGAGRRLDLSTDTDRCKFLLSIGYAYQLLSKMVVTVPEVSGRRAMYTEDVVGDRVIRFYSNSVRKSIKNFVRFCESLGTELDVIVKAYEAGGKKGCSSLPRLIGTEPVISRTGTYTVEISPLGYSPTVRSEHDIRMLAKNLCEALSVLHGAGLVHRDLRYPNVVQVSKEQFVLIDLETVAVAPFQVREGFQWFTDWTNETLEEGNYTPMSDMYQLGKLLNGLMPRVSTGLPWLFIDKLLRKKYTAAMALGDPWLSDPNV